ncbi:MAG: cation:proton antiporter [Candidatus Poribacteria bacterium]|jgi:Trk K+ transport system NAD-binding subunit/Kef-type K+ transport system membrane component KefB|nr:cation:proton antiporter [Candidatus Poribacteria bacterium]MDP6961101.1 cation:proton antiporter [Dehalococcoidia bacterium]
MHTQILLFTSLLITVFAAKQIGQIVARFKLPLITGFLLVGVIAGPFVLNIIEAESLPQLLFLDRMALAFIAFAAGAELEKRVIQGYLRSIVSLIGGLVISVLAIGISTFVLIQDRIPFMASLPFSEVIAIALLGATIMIARSPASALAIIKELRARGPFTHKVLGATVLMDAVVIMIFAAAVSFAQVLVKGADVNLGLLLFVAFEILFDLGLGVLLGAILRLIMLLPTRPLKGALTLLLGMSVFWLSALLHSFHLFSLPIGLFSEPLLICLTAGFYVTNYSSRASEFQHLLEEMSPGIFLVFFTLVGLGLELAILGQAWQIVILLFAARLGAIFIGCFMGTAVARDSGPGNVLLGFGFITQAGVSIGLAKEVAVEFSNWGTELSTLSIGVVVLNQILGPPALKWVINRIGESHTHATANPNFRGQHNVIIFGIEGESLALARQLEAHQWRVTLVGRHMGNLGGNAVVETSHIEFMPEITEVALSRLDVEEAESVVLMLSDEENLAICEIIYEQFGVENVIVRLNERHNFEEFHQLGALVVEPATAMVSLLDQFVRSPFAASLLLGMDPDEEFMELEMNNPDLSDIAIREIHFPHDVLILSISRQGDRIISDGSTRLRLGDHVALVGTPDSLAEVEVRFAA